MGKQLDFYEASVGYIAYLYKFDSKVPLVGYSKTSKHDKFMCGIVLSVNGHDYFAPISSFVVQQRTNIVIKNEKDKPISSIWFSFMTPVLSGVVTVKSIVEYIVSEENKNDN
ncbi:MAG: type III toxin-antitoxin system ToxN/AbiQ family toxin [Defluviitaleaceae bacterium]|nr:type III toxin-antitoxin system ToxN/AbiQ family toxin [Defluviitaleaceae bacterium]